MKKYLQIISLFILVVSVQMSVQAQDVPAGELPIRYMDVRHVDAPEVVVIRETIHEREQLYTTEQDSTYTVTTTVIKSPTDLMQYFTISSVYIGLQYLHMVQFDDQNTQSDLTLPAYELVRFNMDTGGGNRMKVADLRYITDCPFIGSDQLLGANFNPWFLNNWIHQGIGKNGTIDIPLFSSFVTNYMNLEITFAGGKMGKNWAVGGGLVILQTGVPTGLKS